MVSRKIRSAVHRNAFVSTFATLILVASIPVSAGRYAYAPDKRAEGLSSMVNDREACDAYLKNLNKFQDRPYGMACRRELDPKLGFTRPTWEKLDVLKHIPLTIAIMGLEQFPQDPALREARIKEMVEKENFVLDVTRVDLNGKIVNLVRFGFYKPCDPKLEIDPTDTRWNNHLGIRVANEALTGVDPYSRKGFYSSALDDVFIYNGKVFTDVFTSEPIELRVQRKRVGRLELFHFIDLGVTRACTFTYSNTTTPYQKRRPQ